MVTPNVRSVSNEFQGMVEDRDVQSMAAVAAVGAAGGVIAQQVAEYVLPVLGFSERPTDATGLTASFAVKLVAAFALGYVAIEVGGTIGVAMLTAGLGALVLAGADAFSMVTGLVLDSPVGGMVSGGNTSARKVSSSSSTNRVRARRKSGSSSSSSSAPKAAAGGVSFR